jgi:DNA (cytosine-5)-methyltransferase 1
MDNLNSHFERRQVNEETMEPTHLDLFSGIGGFALAARWAGFRTIGFCEIDKYCQRVLAKNFNVYTHNKGQSGVTFNDEMAVMFDDIRKLWGTQFRGVDLITGGFPCQPFSCAGKRRGKEDDRHLWPEMLRVINEARPAWVLGENVTGIIAMELDSVLSDLESIGYATRTFVIPACGVDAPHRRNRVWIVAHAGCVSGDRRSRERRGSQSTESCDQFGGSSEHAFDVADTKHDGWITTEPGLGAQGSAERQNDALQSAGQSGVRFVLPETTAERNRHRLLGKDESRREDPRNNAGNAFSRQDVVDAHEQGSQGHGRLRKRRGQLPSGSCSWLDEGEWFAQSRMGRVAHGIPYRVDRLKGLGNAIVPQVAYQILKPIYNLIMEERNGSQPHV